MKKLFGIALVLIMVAGCGSKAVEYTPPVIPADLQDCKFYSMRTNGYNMRVVRCPNSSVSTTFSQGKSTTTTVTIDG